MKAKAIILIVMWLMAAHISPAVQAAPAGPQPARPAAPFVQELPPPAEILGRIAAAKAVAPFFSDPFRQDEGTWRTSTGPGISHDYQTGSYHIRIEPGVDEPDLLLANSLRVNDFYLELNAFHVTDSQHLLVLLFRYVDDQNHYLFAETAQGNYFLARRLAGAVKVLFAGSAPETFFAGQEAPVALGVLAEGPQISLIGNGQVLTTIVDDTFAAGQVGLQTVSSDDGEVTEVAFDDFAVWKAPQTVNKHQASASGDQATGEALAQISGQWQGEIEGQVYGQPFRLPVTIEFKEPGPFETNPVHFFMGAGDPDQLGSLSLYSASDFISPSGGAVTLQYFTLELKDSQLKAVLANAHAAEAAMANQFTAPNVTAQNAPAIMRPTYESLGSSEIFALLEGAELTIDFSGEKLTGSIRGKGDSAVGIFPNPDVVYQADFVATRGR